MTCETCKYYRNTYCLKHPPVLLSNGASGFPRVETSAWCGAWEPSARSAPHLSTSYDLVRELSDALEAAEEEVRRLRSALADHREGADPVEPYDLG